MAPVVARLGDKRSMLIGILSGVVAAAVGVVLIILPQGSVAARSSMVVLPIGGLAQQDSASFYETLNQGQIVDTLAYMAQSNVATGPQSNVQVAAVPNTSIIRVSATAATADEASRAANAMAEGAQQTIRELRTPFTIAMVVPAVPELATPVGPSLPVRTALVALVAALLGLGVQQLVWTLGGRRRRVPSADKVHRTHPAPSSTNGIPVSMSSAEWDLASTSFARADTAIIEPGSPSRNARSDL